MAEYDDDRPDFDAVFGDEPGETVGRRRRGLRRPRRDDPEPDPGETAQVRRPRRLGRDEPTPLGDADMPYSEPSGDEPPRRASRGRSRLGGGGGGGSGPRRPRRSPGGSRGGGGGAAVLQQPATRLLLGLVFVAILVVVIFLVVQSCQRNALEDSYRGYMNGVTEVSATSSEQGQALRATLNNSDGLEPAALRGQVQELATQAEALVTQADDLDPPDKLRDAQQSLILALEYRVAALRQLAEALPNLIASEDEQTASTEIAERMQLLLASDVIYANSFVGPARQAQEDDDITGIEVPEGEPFLPNAQLASPAGAETLLAGLQRGGGDGGTGEPVGDGSLKGHEIISVATTGGATLTADQANTVPFDQLGTSWVITVENGGDFLEEDVLITATLSYEGGGAAGGSAEQTLEAVEPKSQATVEIPVPDQGNLDFTEQGTLTVTVEPVEGETNPDNNTQSYPIRITI